MRRCWFVLTVSRFLFCFLLAIGAADGPLHAANDTLVVAQASVTEKDAYAAAKDLGTIEAWEAFLENYPKGFYADLARAYLKKEGSKEAAESPPAKEKKASEQAAAKPAPAGPADISLNLTANQPHCTAGTNCSYTVVATNVGATAYAGQGVFAFGFLPGSANLLFYQGGTWGCHALGGGAACHNTEPPLGPGQSATISFTYALPNTVSGALTACAQMTWSGMPSASGVADVQRALNQRGFNAGPVDGQAGQATRNAVLAFQQKNGLRASGDIDVPLIFSLFAQPAEKDANPANDRACVNTQVIGAPAPVSATIRPAPNAVTHATPQPRLNCRSNQVQLPSGKCGCPGDQAWNGSRCVSRQQARRPQSGPAPRLNCRSNQVQLPSGKCGCPAVQVWSGSKCVNRQQANQPQNNLAPALQVLQGIAGAIQQQKAAKQRQKRRKTAQPKTGIGNPVSTTVPSTGIGKPVSASTKEVCIARVRIKQLAATKVVRERAAKMTREKVDKALENIEQNAAADIAKC